MDLERTLTRIDDLLRILEDRARTGFFGHTEPIEAVTIFSRLRSQFSAVAGIIPTFTPDQALEVETDAKEFLGKLEQRCNALLQAKVVQA